MKKQFSPISHVASRRSVNLPNSIEEFLRRQSVAPREKLHCPECGSVMQNAETSFTSFETEKAWNLTVPGSGLRPEVSEEHGAVDMLCTVAREVTYVRGSTPAD
jgi:hypothetical protein